jgi:hypothetical protein
MAVLLGVAGSLLYCGAEKLSMRLYDRRDSWPQAVKRVRTSCRMLWRVAKVTVSHGPKQALAWTKNARRLQEDSSLKSLLCSTIETGRPVVPKDVVEGIDAMFCERERNGEKSPFSQPGQTICYVDDFPPELLPALERLYEDVLRIVNEATGLRLNPIKKSFAERFYAIDYPGPSIELPFHYDCNDANDYKCQILLSKSDGAPSLWVGKDARGEKRPFDEDVRNVCLFHPHSTYHGIPQGEGSRRVFLCTYTKLMFDHRPLVCHADLIST